MRLLTCHTVRTLAVAVFVSGGLNAQTSATKIMEPLDPSRRGAGDLSFVAAYAASFPAWGVYGSGAHAPGETINLARQSHQMRRVALYIYKLTR